MNYRYLSNPSALAREGYGQPPVGGEGSRLNHAGKIVLQKRVCKKNHRKSYRNMLIHESHPDSYSPRGGCIEKVLGVGARCEAFSDAGKRMKTP